MLHFLQSFFTEQKPKDAAYDDALIDAAMERVISGTDPRLVAVGGYKRKLRPAVEKSVSYVIEVVDRRELELPKVGVIDLVDRTTGRVVEVDTSRRATRERCTPAVRPAVSRPPIGACPRRIAS